MHNKYNISNKTQTAIPKIQILFKVDDSCRLSFWFWFWSQVQSDLVIKPIFDLNVLFLHLAYTYTYCSRLHTCKIQMITPDCGFGPSLVLNNQNLLPVPGYNYKKLEGVNTTPHVRIMPALIYSIIFKKN